MTQPDAPPGYIRAYSRLLRALPLAGGLTRLSFNPLTDAAFSQVRGLTPTQMLNGIRILVDTRDHDGRVLFLFGTNDPKVHHITQALLRPGDRFFDIGANYASIGLLAADRVGESGRVHLFEPQPHLCEAIRFAIRESGLSNVQLHQAALLNREDTMQLARPSDHSGMATLMQDGKQPNWETLTVEVKDISTYLPPLVEGRPFGAKIDVEGAEIYLLPWLLAQPTLRFVVFEAAQNREQLWDIVRSSSFVLYGLDRTFFVKRVRRIDSLPEMPAFHDLVAIRFPPSVTPPATAGSRSVGRLARQSD